MADAPYDLCACPSCGTEFRVTAADLAVDDGQVRCGACMAVFDGRARREAPPALTEADTPAPRPASTSLAGARDGSSASDVGAQLGAQASRLHRGATPALPASATKGLSTSGPEPDVAAAGAQSPASPRNRRHRRPATQRARRPRVGWRLAGVVVFGAALAANAMALRHQTSEPDLAAFEFAAPTVERTESPSGFAVTGRLINRARAPQRLPSLLVRLQHKDATIAEARFRPGEYLAGRRTRMSVGTLLDGTLAARESVAVAVRIEDAAGPATAATVTLAWPP